jgi:ribA/ribD-fused uncharacterized protein
MMTQEIIGPFVGDYEFLSNFYPVPILFKGKMYPTVEHAFVASKTFDMDAQEKIRNYPAKMAGYAKTMGRGLVLRKDWEEVKEEIMQGFLIQKFYRHDPLKFLLMQTDPHLLVERNWWHDNYWGNCTCRKCANIFGKNTLGKMLMSIRQNIKDGVLL